MLSSDANAANIRSLKVSLGDRGPTNVGSVIAFPRHPEFPIRPPVVFPSPSLLYYPSSPTRCPTS